MTNEELKARLEAMRDSGDWARLAVEAGLNYWTLQRIAAGKVKPQRRTAEKLNAAILLRESRERRAA